jgi:two-component system sensor histidine kinase/response regulator
MKMTIEDNGVGISKDNQSKLFSEFTKLKEHSNMNAKGTGLGLSICKNIIEQMGGNVVIQSEEGQGTKFHITIGLKADELVSRQSKLNLLKTVETKRKLMLDYTLEFKRKFRYDLQTIKEQKNEDTTPNFVEF